MFTYSSARHFPARRPHPLCAWQDAGELPCSIPPPLVPSHPLQVSNVQFTSGNRGVDNGFQGIWVKGSSSDNLITAFNFTTRFVRDISLQGVVVGNVISNGEPQSSNVYTPTASQKCCYC